MPDYRHDVLPLSDHEILAFAHISEELDTEIERNVERQTQRRQRLTEIAKYAASFIVFSAVYYVGLKTGVISPDGP